MILPYVLRDNVALSFAVGEWARVWPLDVLFKSFGSYFIRRDLPRQALPHRAEKVCPVGHQERSNTGDVSGGGLKPRWFPA